MSITALVVALALASSSGGKIDWRTEAGRLTINKALSNWADQCSHEFGFARLIAYPPDVMAGRIEAHLLLAGSDAESEIIKWARLMRDANNAYEATVDRGADAIMAAIADPSSYARAEALYLESNHIAMRSVYSACESGVNDQFLSANYINGDGVIDNIDENLKADFRKSVAELGKLRDDMNKKSKR